MKDYEAAIAIYQQLKDYQFEPFTLHIGEAEIEFREYEISNTDDGNIHWLSFTAEISDQDYTYGHYSVMLRLGRWERNFFSNGQSYYIIGYVNNNYHHEVSLKNLFPDKEVTTEDVLIETPIRYTQRDGGLNNELRRKHTISILEQLGCEVEGNKLGLGTWSINRNAFVDGTEHFIKNMLATTLVKAHFRKGNDILIPGLPQISSDLLIEERNDSMTRIIRSWKIAPGPDAEGWDTALEHNNIFIGWPELGNLDQYETKEELVEQYKEVYEIDYNPMNDSFTLWAFHNDIEIGDVVFANRGGKCIVGIGRFSGNYEWDNDEHYPNKRKVEWLFEGEIHFDSKIFPNKTLSIIDSTKLETIREAVYEQVENGQEIWEQLYGRFEKENQINMIDAFYNYVRSRKFYFSKELLARFIYSLKSKPFVILSGISGTGKTKIAQLFAEFISKSRPENLQAETTNVFEYTLHPYNFNYSRMIVPVAIMETLELPDLDKGQEIILQFDQMNEPALIKKEERGHTRLGFRKQFNEWLQNHFQAGSSLYMQIFENGQCIRFYKTKPEKEIIPAKQWCFLSVRPDWLDHRGLLGYYNPILQKYQVSEMLRIMLRAKKHPNSPFFIILDEMNLAKVEYYFSDFLSCLESRRISKDNNLIQEKISLHQEFEQGISFVDEDNTIYSVPTDLEIPENLYFIGTVNIDETTYMFSPKVLDRAHVLECNEINFQTYWEDQEKKTVNTSVTSVQAMTEWFTHKGDFHRGLYSKQFLNTTATTSRKDKMKLADQFNQLLKKEGHLFGYRVFDEIFFFLDQMAEDRRWSDDDLFDMAILQKILPKLHGNRAQMDSLLNQMFRFCLSDDYEELPFAINEDFEDYSLFRFPRSTEKIKNMYRQMLRTGYCSFIM